MPKSESHSDVVEMCRWAAMNPANYKRFESPLTSAKAETPEAELLRDNQTRTTTTEKLTCEAKPPGILPAESTPPTLQYSPFQRQLVALANVHGRVTSQPSVLPLMSAVGGCGVTTVLATLGRALSILGERVLLIDSPGPSTLQSFYNSRNQGSGILLSTDPLSQFEGQVHVFRNPAELRPSAQAGSTRFHRAMAELGGRLDRILVAGAQLDTSALHGQQPSSTNLCLVVITPELRSVLAAPCILQSFNRDVNAWFVLNRFNPEDSSEIQFRDRLHQTLGERLLPFWIPECPSVKEALLRGASVLDVAPQSAIADAFFDLAEWYRSQCAVEHPSLCAFEETQLAVSN